MRTTLCMAVAACLALPCLVRAQTGGLDRSFAQDGRFVYGDSAAATAIALDADGRILVGGFQEVEGRYPGDPYERLLILRLNQDGSLDEEFASGGVLVADVGPHQSAAALRVQPDGKILSGSKLFQVARFHEDGALDATFGNGGIAGSWHEAAFSNALLLQPDGKIIMAGFRYVRFLAENRYVMDDDVMLVRLLSDGRQDATFGRSGVVTTNVADHRGLLESVDQVHAAALLPDGKILVAGSTTMSSFQSYDDFLLLRYTAEGRLDSTFGRRGVVTTDFGEVFRDVAYDLAVQPDGKIVVAGNSTDPLSESSVFALARYTPDGQRDVSFGEGGIVRAFQHLGHASGDAALSVLPDGRIAAVWNAMRRVNGAGFYDYRADFTLLLFSPSGEVVTAFGQSGRLPVGFDAEGWSDDRARAMAVQPDGSIVVAGSANLEPTERRWKVAVVRYLPVDQVATWTVPDMDGRRASELHAYPNPFGETLDVVFVPDVSQDVSVAIYDVLGRRVRTLFEGFAQAGAGVRATAGTEGLTPGLYVLRVQGVGIDEVRSVVKLR